MMVVVQALKDRPVRWKLRGHKGVIEFPGGTGRVPTLRHHSLTPPHSHTEGLHG